MLAPRLHEKCTFLHERYTRRLNWPAGAKTRLVALAGDHPLDVVVEGSRATRVARVARCSRASRELVRSVYPASRELRRVPLQHMVSLFRPSNEPNVCWRRDRRADEVIK